MTDKKSSESRRKLLKSIAAGSGAVIAGKSLPETWSRPVVDSVILPSHAQTSPAALSCIGTTDTTPSGEGGIILNFDGNSTCAFFNATGPGDVVPDTMLIIDLDQLSDTDIVLDQGANWVPQSQITDVPSGTYTFTVTRAVNPNAGMAFNATVTFSTSGTNPNKSLTATLDNLVPA